MDSMNQEQLDKITMDMIGVLGDLNRMIHGAQNVQKTIQEMMSDIHAHQIKNYTPEQKAMYEMLLERNKEN
jgi:5'(3')-deoxyribonucleotidase